MWHMMFEVGSTARYQPRGFCSLTIVRRKFLIFGTVSPATAWIMKQKYRKWWISDRCCHCNRRQKARWYCMGQTVHPRVGTFTEYAANQAWLMSHLGILWLHLHPQIPIAHGRKVLLSCLCSKDAIDIWLYTSKWHVAMVSRQGKRRNLSEEGCPTWYTRQRLAVWLV